MPDADLFDLQRFVSAQDRVWPEVSAELAAGAKTSHWMWFVFPQLKSLGRSGTARYYGITSLDEARAYGRHPVLGARLRACCGQLQRLRGLAAVDVFGTVDALKLRSCLTLFEQAVPDEPVFGLLLAQYCGGERDPLTRQALRASE